MSVDSTFLGFEKMFFEVEILPSTFLELAINDSFQQQCVDIDENR